MYIIIYSFHYQQSIQQSNNTCFMGYILIMVTLVSLVLHCRSSDSVVVEKRQDHQKESCSLFQTTRQGEKERSKKEAKKKRRKNKGFKSSNIYQTCSTRWSSLKSSPPLTRNMYSFVSSPIIVNLFGFLNELSISIYFNNKNIYGNVVCLLFHQNEIFWHDILAKVQTSHHTDL